MACSLLVVFSVSSNPILALIMTFVTGTIAFSVGSPIQMLMINTAKGSEMLAASASQASFNIGNALGAFWGGLPLVAGYSYSSPQLVGAGMALTGGLLAYILLANRKRPFFIKMKKGKEL